MRSLPDLLSCQNIHASYIFDVPYVGRRMAREYLLVNLSPSRFHICPIRANEYGLMILLVENTQYINPLDPRELQKGDDTVAVPYASSINIVPWSWTVQSIYTRVNSRRSFTLPNGILPNCEQ